MLALFCVASAWAGGPEPLSWDRQAGGDGQTACATIHFHADADHRHTNQLNGNLGPGIQPLGLDATAPAALAPGMVSPSRSAVFLHEGLDPMVEIPEVGGGRTSPLQTFAELVGIEPASGALAHDVTEDCTMP